VAPREGSLGAGLDGDDGVGLGCGVGTAVADDVVRCHVCDGLRWLLAAVSRRPGREDVRETYAIVRGNADAITNSTAVQRDKDGVRSRRRSGSGNSEGCGELHRGLDRTGGVLV
jgi:hypothetical protein